jgi:REP element-mobilizing transposase RayT
MNFYENQYYHLYNRTNNEEVLFRSDDNYLYFLKKFRFYFDDYLDTIGYCLMPTHFHFLVRVKSVTSDVQHFESVGHLTQPEDVVHLASLNISRAMQTLQSSYTKAINKRFNRHGSLFQSHFKSKFVQNDRYLISLLTYIHQNPIRSRLVEKAEDWKYSSYQDYIDFRKGTLPQKEFILDMIKKNELRELTEKKLIEL